MKTLIAVLFYGIIGLLAGIQFSPEGALISGLSFAVAGVFLSNMVIIPFGIFGSGATVADKKEKKIREEINSLVDQMEGIINLAEEETRDLTDEESQNWQDLDNKVKKLRQDLKRHQETQAHRDSLNQGAKPLNEDGTLDEGGIIKVTGDRAESKESLFENVANIFRAIMTPRGKMSQVQRDKMISNAFESLIQGGHYKGFGIKNAVEAFSTLTDPDGGIFLPTSISSQIMEIEREYGVFPGAAMRIPLTVGGGRQILPNLLGEITFHAVNQGSEANASRFTFSGIALEELKWMAFVPWTNEMGAAAGNILVPLILRKLGEASAGIKDDAVINGNGTSTYHNHRGLIARSGDSSYPEVRLSTAASTHNAFSKIDEDDLINATLDVAPSIRGRGIFIMHPDWRVYLALIKDANEVPLFKSGGVISLVNGQWSIFGYPVLFSEKMVNTDGASKEYAIFCNPEYLAFGDVGAFSAEELTEATIKDVNGSDIRLASQDMRALRVKQFFDFELSQLVISSGGNNLGAFTVLRTSAS